MVSYLSSEPGLLKLRFNRRCYSLLHNAVIEPGNLDNFYRTYRLPKNPFFPLFFLIKRDYLAAREKGRFEREEYIRTGLSRLPAYIKVIFTLCSRLEKRMTGRDSCPVYRKSFLPSTKKRTDEYGQFSHGDWMDFFDGYLDKLAGEYEHLPLKKVEYLGAALALQWEPDQNYGMPSAETVTRLYRELSKAYHPDRGGNSHYFIKVKWAKDYFRG
ncbi:MAG: hypothetical protein JXR86_17885 [Spirochaetales bacterium]|nr:hypothetical protein [Spirochaetales bacterium]